MNNNFFIALNFLVSNYFDGSKVRNYCITYKYRDGKMYRFTTLSLSDYILAHFLLIKRNPLFTWFGGLPFKRRLFERKIFFRDIIKHENILFFCLVQVEFRCTISSNLTFWEAKTHHDIPEKPSSEAI